ncbi:MAG TPA: DUF4468 domain-containing protein [Puia sp.]|jgi:hypothetical protein|nr:DUF4468 domain-containing protein [Puia sp.]
MRCLLFLFLLPTICYSQTDLKEITEEQVKSAYDSLPIVDSQYQFIEVVQLDPSFSQGDLYKNAKLFFANAFRISNNNLSYDDREEGKLIGKGSFQINGSQKVLFTSVSETRTTSFNLEIFCKDGKYRYRIYNIYTDYLKKTNKGGSYDRIESGDASLEKAYTLTENGSTKKMNRNLFYNTIAEIKNTQALIKQYMSKKPTDTGVF